MGSTCKSFSDIFDDIDGFKIAGRFNNDKNQSQRISKIIGFVYKNIMKFLKNELLKGEIFFWQFFRQYWLFNFQ